MLRKAWSGLWRPRNPHSLDHLKYLHSVLSKNQTVTEGNKGLLVETIRSIAEILIWGDQNDSSVFDFFLERNMLSFFLKFMDQKTGNNYVCVQLLQTLNILFENIRNDTSIYYLLSNNHVNSIIVHKFDFSDEEVMAYYISFLKTLSFRLNKHTIHFFYNEHNNDFPLYTEAIKFFNHGESMVRIAVRTLSLNVYRVEDERMIKFVTDKTAAPYFSNLVWFIGNHILEIDDCVRNDADHNSMDKLKDVVAEHLDHLHYINDILCLDIEPLNRVLTDHLLNRLFIPLYIYSFARASLPGEDMKPYVSPVVALFLLCQVFLIITHIPLVRLLAWILLAGDTEVFTERAATLAASLGPRPCSSGSSITKPSFMAPPEPLDRLLARRLATADLDSEAELEAEQAMDAAAASVHRLTGLPVSPHHTAAPARPGPASLSITDEEKQILLESEVDLQAGLERKPFLAALLSCLDHADNDYFQLFALCLIYALQVNTGINRELLESAQLSGGVGYNRQLVERMVGMVGSGCCYDSRVRLVTLEILLASLQQLVIRQPGGESVLLDEHLAAVEGAREESVLILRNYYKSEEIFLDMFEDEYREMTKRPTNFEFVMSDASLLLPPTGTPLTGIDFRKRLPCGEVEKARKAIRTFFLVRGLSLRLRGEQETALPLSNPDSFVQAGDVLDLNNSDLLAVTVTSKDGARQRRFLVVDLMQIILIEPDGHRLGWGVARFSGFLQDLEVAGDKEDSRCLHVTVHKPSSTTRGSPAPFLAAAFTFDDHIRCMAAKQRLTKGRAKARQRKMHLIARLLEMPEQVCPASPPRPLTLATLRQQAGRRASRPTPGHAPLRHPGAAALVTPARPRPASPATALEVEPGGMMMEPLRTGRGRDCSATPQQETETSFETGEGGEVVELGTTWYVESGEGGVQNI